MEGGTRLTITGKYFDRHAASSVAEVKVGGQLFIGYFIILCILPYVQGLIGSESGLWESIAKFQGAEK